MMMFCVARIARKILLTQKVELTALIKRQLKQRDVLECGSTAGPVKDKDPMIIGKWKEMKENGKITEAYQHRSSQTGNLKMMGTIRMELANKEQVDKFKKLAAPKALLSSLNPGIIDHVRNRKQAESIIKSLLLSKEQENPQDRIRLGHVRGRVGEASDGSEQSKQRNTYNGTNSVFSGNISGADSLSVKAANVASQWLQLLHQDIKGKLTGKGFRMLSQLSCRQCW